MSDHLYRIDTFIVPESSQAVFLEKVYQTHGVLAQCRGFVRDIVVRKMTNDSECRIVTVVEWTDQTAMDAAKDVIGEIHRSDGFSPPEFFEKLGIEADLALYEDAEISF